jgi:hypothetical protein
VCVRGDDLVVIGLDDEVLRSGDGVSVGERRGLERRAVLLFGQGRGVGEGDEAADLGGAARAAGRTIQNGRRLGTGLPRRRWSGRVNLRSSW